VEPTIDLLLLCREVAIDSGVVTKRIVKLTFMQASGVSTHCCSGIGIMIIGSGKGMHKKPVYCVHCAGEL
jgi:hypothetical protein